MNEITSRKIAESRATLKDHVLHVAIQTDGYTVAYLHPPQGQNWTSVLVMATPEGIFIAGRLLQQHCGGVLSAAEARLDWFKDPGMWRSPDHLASRFLKKQWDQDLAHEVLCRDAEAEDPDTAENLSVLIAAAEDGESALYDAIALLGWDNSYMPGWDYKPTEVGWLVAVQERFAALYTQYLAINCH